MKITVESMKDFIDIVAGLVKKGLNFTAHKKDTKWVIEFTGGY